MPETVVGGDELSLSLRARIVQTPTPRLSDSWTCFSPPLDSLCRSSKTSLADDVSPHACSSLAADGVITRTEFFFGCQQQSLACVVLVRSMFAGPSTSDASCSLVFSLLCSGQSCSAKILEVNKVKQEALSCVIL
jgi:hypothetical protein